MSSKLLAEVRLLAEIGTREVGMHWHKHERMLVHMHTRTYLQEVIARIKAAEHVNAKMTPYRCSASKMRSMKGAIPEVAGYLPVCKVPSTHSLVPLRQSQIHEVQPPLLGGVWVAQ